MYGRLPRPRAGPGRTAPVRRRGCFGGRRRSTRQPLRGRPSVGRVRVPCSFGNRVVRVRRLSPARHRRRCRQRRQHGGGGCPRRRSIPRRRSLAAAGMVRLRPTASGIVRPRWGRRNPGRAGEATTVRGRNGHAGHGRRGAPPLLPVPLGILPLWLTRLLEHRRRRVVPTPRQARPTGMARAGSCTATRRVATRGGCATVPLRRSGGALLASPRSLGGRIPPPRRHGGPRRGADKMRRSFSLLRRVLRVLAGSRDGSGREQRRALPRRSGARSFNSPAFTHHAPVFLLTAPRASLSSFLRWRPDHR